MNPTVCKIYLFTLIFWHSKRYPKIAYADIITSSFSFVNRLEKRLFAYIRIFSHLHNKKFSKCEIIGAFLICCTMFYTSIPLAT